MSLCQHKDSSVTVSTQDVQSGADLVAHPPHSCRRLRSSEREIAHSVLAAREPSVLKASMSSRGGSPKAGQWLTYTAGQNTFSAASLVR